MGSAPTRAIFAFRVSPACAGEPWHADRRGAPARAAASRRLCMVHRTLIPLDYHAVAAGRQT